MRIAPSLPFALLLFLALGLGGAPPAFAQDGEAASTAGQTPIAEGETAPTFHLTASDGTEFSLQDLEGRKNLVLVFFRGTW